MDSSAPKPALWHAVENGNAALAKHLLYDTANPEERWGNRPLLERKEGWRYCVTTKADGAT